MKTIICSINLFSRSPISVMIDNETGEVQPLGFTSLSDNIWQDIFDACVNTGAQNIKLFGSQDVCIEIAKNIARLEKTTYGKNSIEIEVITQQ